VGARNHADDPKGKPPELLRESEGREAQLTTMMAEIHGPIVGEQAITPFLKTGTQIKALNLCRYSLAKPWN